MRITTILRTDTTYTRQCFLAAKHTAHVRGPVASDSVEPSLVPRLQLGDQDICQLLRAAEVRAVRWKRSSCEIYQTMAREERWVETLSTVARLLKTLGQPLTTVGWLRRRIRKRSTLVGYFQR